MAVSVQAIWHDASLFTREEASAWCVEHGFSTEVYATRASEDGSVTHHIHRQFPTAEAVEGTWRTISDTFPEGITASTCVRAEERSMDEYVGKAHATFEVKSIDEEQRVIKGIASTPSVDRDGDTVVPEGASFKLPFPLLHQHDHERPIGHVKSASVDSDGIAIEAEIPKDSGLDYVETAWKQIKSGLLRGLSIGFRPTKTAPTSAGRKFLAYEIFELSAVSIPANAEASILSVKKYDSEPLDSEEQLFDIESKKSDVMDRAAATIAKASEVLKS